MIFLMIKIISLHWGIVVGKVHSKRRIFTMSRIIGLFHDSSNSQHFVRIVRISFGKSSIHIHQSFKFPTNYSTPSQYLAQTRKLKNMMKNTKKLGYPKIYGYAQLWQCKRSPFFLSIYIALVENDLQVRLFPFFFISHYITKEVEEEALFILLLLLFVLSLRRWKWVTFNLLLHFHPFVLPLSL